MALRKSNGDAMAPGTGIPASGDLHRPHSRLDQGKLPGLESSLDWALTAPQAPVIAIRPTVPASPAHRDCDPENRKKIEQPERSVQAFDKRHGYSSDLGRSAIDDQNHHASGSGE
jgi:hypothetical protein